MNKNYDAMRAPKKQKAIRAAFNIQLLNDMLQDPLWMTMTTTLGMYRRDSNFPELLRCFWTTLCVCYGIDSNSTAYDCLLDRLRDTYKGVGVEINERFLDAFLEFDGEPDDI